MTTIYTSGYSNTQAALDALPAHGGRVIHDGGNETVTSTIEVPSNTTLECASGSLWTLGAAVETHLMELINVSDVTLVNPQIDGNNAGQEVAAHCLRLDNVTRIQILGGHIRDSESYCIGAQGGTIDTLLIEGTLISDSGEDGIDIKNPNSENRHIRIVNVVVERFGTDGNSQKAGLDIRGVGTLVTGCQVTPDVNADGPDCIRLRYGQAGVEADPWGDGGHQSIISNCHVNANGVATVTGFNIGGDNATVANLVAVGCDQGFLFTTDHAVATNLTAIDCRKAVFIKANNCLIQNLIGLDCTLMGARIYGSNNRIEGGRLTGVGSGTKGFYFKPGAANNRMLDVLASGFTYDYLPGGINNIMQMLDGTAL